MYTWREHCGYKVGEVYILCVWLLCCIQCMSFEEGGGIYPVSLAVVLYTVHVILGEGRYMSCVSGCGAVYTWMEGALWL